MYRDGVNVVHMVFYKLYQIGHYYLYIYIPNLISIMQ